MGNSGGGTQTAYLMALDERIKCASPSCYITSFDRLLKTIGPQDAEQNIAGQLAAGMDHADYLMMRAPRPTLICAATQDFFDIQGTKDAYAEATSFYQVFDAEEKVSMVETDAKHGYSQPLREAAATWMVRWLREEDREITEPEINVLSDEEIQVTPAGQVLKLTAAVSAFELNRRRNKQLADKRAMYWKETPRREALAELRRLTGIRPISQLPFEERQGGKKVGEDNYAGFGYWQIIKVEKEVNLPMVIFGPPDDFGPKKPDQSPEKDKKKTQPYILYVDDQGFANAGRDDGPIRKLVDQGRGVVALDLRGFGLLKSKNVGRETTVSYLLGKSLLGQQAEDILHGARHIDRWFGSQFPDSAIDLIATGDAGPAALHAAVLEPELFRKVRIEGSLDSWSEMIENPEVRGHYHQVVHGALTKYDLPDLVKLLGDKVEIVDPLKLGKNEDDG